MTKILVILLVFLLQCSLCLGLLFDIENETIEVQLIVENICFETQDKIFRIERVNYSNTSTPLDITYQTSCAGTASNVSTTINKFVQAQTGSCFFNQTANHTISIVFGNISEEFSQNITCTTQEKQDGLEGNLTDIIPTKPSVISDCFEQFRIETNAVVFEKGDQLLIDFTSSHTPQNFTIKYWIETLDGVVLKSARNTTNTNTKKHTFSTIQKEEQGAYIYSTIYDECGEQHTKELILLQGEVPSKEEIEEVLLVEPSLEIISSTVKEDQLEVSFRAQRGNSRSSVLNLEIRNDVGTLLGTEKFKLTSTQSSIETTTLLPLSDAENKIHIELSGLGLLASKTINIPAKTMRAKIIQTHTKQDSFEDRIDWYVRTKQDRPIVLEINSSNTTTYWRISKPGERTTKISIPYAGGKIFTTLYEDELFHTTEDDLDIIHAKKIEDKQVPELEEEKTRNTTRTSTNRNSTGFSTTLHDSLAEEKIIGKQTYLWLSIILLLVGLAALFRQYVARKINLPFSKNKFIK